MDTSGFCIGFQTILLFYICWRWSFKRYPTCLMRLSNISTHSHVLFLSLRTHACQYLYAFITICLNKVASTMMTIRSLQDPLPAANASIRRELRPDHTFSQLCDMIIESTFLVDSPYIYSQTSLFMHNVILALSQIPQILDLST